MPFIQLLMLIAEIEHYTVKPSDPTNRHMLGYRLIAPTPLRMDTFIDTYTANIFSFATRSRSHVNLRTISCNLAQIHIGHMLFGATLTLLFSLDSDDLSSTLQPLFPQTERCKVSISNTV